MTMTANNHATHHPDHSPAGHRPTPWLRGLLLWLLIVLGESLNGTLREFAIKPLIGDHAARQLGVLIGSLLILLLAQALLTQVSQSRRAEFCGQPRRGERRIAGYFSEP